MKFKRLIEIIGILLCGMLIYLILTITLSYDSQEELKIYIFGIQNEYTCHCILSALSNKLDVTVIGFKEIDTLHILYKILQHEKNIFSWTSDSSPIIVFANGYNTIFQDTKAQIMEKYYRFDDKLIFGADKHCLPTKDSYICKLFERNAPNITNLYINTAGAIGRGYDMLSFLEETVKLTEEKTWKDIRELLAYAFIAHNSGYNRLDYNSHLFLTINEDNKILEFDHSKKKWFSMSIIPSFLLFDDKGKQYYLHSFNELKLRNKNRMINSAQIDGSITKISFTAICGDPNTLLKEDTQQV